MMTKRILEQRYKDAGWTVTQTNGGHFKLTHPKVPKPVFTSGTPSDWRARKNLDALIRRFSANIG